MSGDAVSHSVGIVQLREWLEHSLVGLPAGPA